jgi:hypothetical protein
MCLYCLLLRGSPVYGIIYDLCAVITVVMVMPEVQQLIINAGCALHAVFTNDSDLSVHRFGSATGLFGFTCAH